MTPNYTKKQFDLAKNKDKLPLICKHCNTVFYLKKHYILIAMNTKTHKTAEYCSVKCKGKASIKAKECFCEQCNKKFIKTLNNVKRTKHNFCSRSCAASYNNTHKTYGHRKSKMEIWIAKHLPKLHPSNKILFNSKKVINSELDIYIPKLKLAFEISGIFHYKPIFGQEKLSKIRQNDKLKKIKCIKSGIRLHVLNVSKYYFFTEEDAKTIMNLILKKIHNRILELKSKKYKIYRKA